MIPIKIDRPATPAPIVEEIEEHRSSIPHISYTQLSMWNRCSMQHYFRYGLGLRERPKVSMSLGKGGHQALEWATLQKLKHGQDRPAEEVVQMASDFMDLYLGELEPKEYERDAEPGQLKDKQLAATRIFATRDAPTITPLAAEMEYNLDVNVYLPDRFRDMLDTPVRPVNLKIDLLKKDTNTLVQFHDKGVGVSIIDYKYTTKMKKIEEVNMTPQITTYIAAMHQVTGSYPTEAGLLVLHPGSLAKKPRPTDPGPNAYPLMRDPKLMAPEAIDRRMARLAIQFAQTEREIRAGTYKPTDNPMTCANCGFRDRCQASLVDDFEAMKLTGQLQ